MSRIWLASGERQCDRMRVVLVLLDQVLDLPAGAVGHFINVFGIAALQRGDDVADIDASALASIRATTRRSLSHDSTA
jgi:hypothetical protein